MIPVQNSRRLVAFLEYFFIVTILLNFRSVWLYTSGEHFSFLVRAMGYASILVLTFIYIYMFRPKFFVDRMLWLVIPVVCNTALSIWSYERVRSTTLLLTNVYFDFAILLIFIAVHTRRLNSLIVAFVRTVSAVTTFSLLFWLMALVHIPTNSVLNISWATGYYLPIQGYFRVYYLAQGYNSFLGMSLPRNTIFFTEAPMATFVIVSALLMSTFILYRNDNDSMKRLQIVLLIGVFTTGSTTGIIIAIFSVAFNRLQRVRLSPLVILGAGVVIVILSLIAIQILQQKQVANGSSVSIRLDDIQAGTQAWLNHPLFGYGLGQTRAYLSYVQPSRLLIGGNRGFSSGILELLITGGIVYFSQLILLPLGVLSWQNRSFAFMALLFLALLFNTVTYGTFMLSFLSAVFYGLAIEKSAPHVDTGNTDDIKVSEGAYI